VIEKAQERSISIDLNEFKLHIALKKGRELTFHFNSPSRRFYLSLIAFVVNEMKKLGKITSIPLEGHLDLLALLNDTVGGSAGSSDGENLLPRIYRKWVYALPDLEAAPLFKVLGRKKEYDEGSGKTYPFTENEKGMWANLFEYKGSEENVRLKFAIDRIGAGLDDVHIIYGGSINGDAWERFISSLRDKVKVEPEKEETGETHQESLDQAPLPRKWKISWPSRYRWATLIAAIGAVAGAAAIATWGLYIRHAPLPEVTPSTGVPAKGKIIGEVASKDKMAFPLPDKPSIAVLPFVNIGGDKEQEYFSDGLTEEIINALSKVPQVFVIARQSTYFYKGKTVNVRQVAETLGVQYVLEGSVRSVGDKVRVTAQLIDSMKGYHLWSERYEQRMKNKFTLQDEITMKILTELRVKLMEGETARVYAKGTNNLQAYLKVLEGNGCVFQNNKEANAEAIRLYHEAIELDPNYAVAYIRLSRTYARDVHFRPGESREEALVNSMKYAQKAIELDSSLAEAHAALSYVLLMMRQHDKAIEVAERAVKLNPGSASALFSLAVCLHFSGRWEEALPLLRQAIRFNPLVSSFYSFLGAACRETGKYEEGITALKKSLTFFPNDLFAYSVLAGLYMYAGQEGEARAIVAEIMRIDPSFSLKRFGRSQPWKESVDTSHLRDTLHKAGLK
jgi:TolB-like protein